MRRGVCVAALLASHAAAAPFNFATAPGLLPKTVFPSAYEIALTPDLAAATLHGEMRGDITVTQPVNIIVVNAVDLKLANVALDDGQNPATISTDPRAQTVTLRFAAPVAPGPHQLRIVYDGPIPVSPSGLYHDDFTGADGKPSRMLVTQFEAASARRMFPGWDEPAFKARFTLSVVLPPGVTPLSNTRAVKTPAGAGKYLYRFSPTPPMSSYLLALVAGDIDSLHHVLGSTDIAVWAPRGRQLTGAYALSSAERMLGYYNDYFGLAYAMPKLDLIAIPGNFEAGAMENWGAITFIDDALLLDPQNSSAATRERIEGDVAHEIAHQWTGDLVTMGWWSELWLNEGFATFMASKAMDHFNPDWQTSLRDHAAREDAMAADAHATTHAVDTPVRDGADADSVFDEITYQKGAQVIRMLEAWLGPELFRAGMRRYIADHQFRNVSGDDLWAALSDAAGKDVGAVGRGFIEQPGVPLVRMTRRCPPKGAASITLTQDRFTIHDPQAAHPIWTIPVRLAGLGAAPRTVMLGAQPVSIPLEDCAAALKANAGELGYFRTEYDAASLAPLAAHFAALPAADRANLLADQFALFLAGRARLATYLDLIAGLSGETNSTVWEDTLARLRVLDRAGPAPAVRAALHGFARHLLRPEFDRLGWEPRAQEPFTDTLLRPHVIAALAQYDDPDILAGARARFGAMLRDMAAVPADLRAPVLAIAGHAADRHTYDQLMALAAAAPGTEDRLRYLNAAAAAADPTLTAATLAAATAGKLPNGRLLEVLGTAVRDSGNADEVWRQVLAAQPALRPLLSQDGQDLLLPTIAEYAASSAVKRALWAAPSSKSSVAAKRYATRAADAIDSAIELQQRAQPALAAWLKDHP